MQKVIAIDICIIPTDAGIDTSIKLNRQLHNAKNIQLNKINQLPHITLLQGGINLEDYDKAQKMLENILTGFSPVSIVIDEVRNDRNNAHAQI